MHTYMIHDVVAKVVYSTIKSIEYHEINWKLIIFHVEGLQRTIINPKVSYPTKHRTLHEHVKQILGSSPMLILSSWDFHFIDAHLQRFCVWYIYIVVFHKYTKHDFWCTGPVHRVGVGCLLAICCDVYNYWRFLVESIRLIRLLEDIQKQPPGMFLKTLWIVG